MHVFSSSLLQKQQAYVTLDLFSSSIPLVFLQAMILHLARSRNARLAGLILSVAFCSALG